MNVRRVPPQLGVLVALMSVTACMTPGPQWAEAPAIESDDEQYIEVNGAWLRVRETAPKGPSDKPPLILVHGYGSRLEAWREIQPRVSKTRRVVSFDQRGFGKSSRASGEYGPAQHSSDVLALMDHLGIERAILIGHSYGGGVVLRAALDAPDRILGVGLVSAFALEEHIPADFRWAQVPVVGELLFGAFFKEVPGEKYLLAFEDRERFVTIEALDEMSAMMDTPGATYTALATVRGMDYRDAQRAYRNIEAPMVVVWGEKDRVVPLDSGKKLAATVDAPLVVLPACGHMPSWEQPRALLKALAPMLGEADALAIATPTETARRHVAPKTAPPENDTTATDAHDAESVDATRDDDDDSDDDDSDDDDDDDDDDLPSGSFADDAARELDDDERSTGAASPTNEPEPEGER